MDQHVKVMHIVQPHLAMSQEAVTVQLSNSYNRSKLTEDLFAQNIESTIHSIWSERVKDNPKIYNGTKFRLHGVKNAASNKEVEMKIGVTDYKEYLGTNWAPNISELQDLGMKYYNNPQALFSDPLGVGAFLITADNCMVLLRRSVHCGEAQNKWDVPGGHPEPSELVGNLPLGEIDMAQMSEKDVVNEIFNSILREVVDEVNIPMDKLARPLYLGTALNTISSNRPSMVFEIHCTLCSEEIQSLYEQGNQLEAEESTNVQFVPLQTIPSLQEKNKDLWNNLAPSAKDICAMYSYVPQKHEDHCFMNFAEEPLLLEMKATSEEMQTVLPEAF